MNIDVAIKNARLKAMLSQEEFARELGVSFATVNRWETGKTKPNYKTQRQIIEFCETHSIPFSYDERGSKLDV